MTEEGKFMKAFQKEEKMTVIIFIFLFFMYQSITLHDTKIACSQDLGGQFFLREDDVRDRKNRYLYI